MVRKVLSMTAALCLASLLVLAAPPSLQVDKQVYKAEEPVQISFSSATALPDRAWVGIVPSEIPHGSESDADRHDVAYRYVSGQSSGTVTLAAPIKPGAWDVRLLDGQGKELAHAGFEVMLPDYSLASMTLEAEAFDPGSAITLRFTAPEGLAKSAWVGLIPAEVPHGDGTVNDRHDVAYRYISTREERRVELPDAKRRPGRRDRLDRFQSALAGSLPRVDVAREGHLHPG